MTDLTKPKRMFVRGLWGDRDVRRFYDRRNKIDYDIELLLLNKNESPFVACVFGEENEKYLNGLGITTRLVDKRPRLFENLRDNYDHKLLILKHAIGEFDEIIFLDWDCYALKPLPNDFWDNFYKKEPIQSPLYIYNQQKASWRKIDRRKVPFGGFIYVRDRKIPDDLINLKQDSKGKLTSEERVIGKYMDDRIGGWKGLDEYFKLYECDCIRSTRCPFSQELSGTKKIYFHHFNKKFVASMLKQCSKMGKEDKETFVTKHFNCARV